MAAPRKCRQDDNEDVSPLLPKIDPWTDHSRRVERLVITPAIAKMILDDRNPTNRAVKKGQVAFLVDQLKKGLWKENGETLIFDADGDLLDGQHRLTACVISGISFATLVSFGMPSEVYTTIGRSVKRGPADDLHINGERHAKDLAAALSLLAMEEVGRLAAFANPDQYFDPMRVLARHPNIREGVVFARQRQGIFKTLSFSTRVLAFCYYRFHQVDPAKAPIFFDQLLHGVGLTADSPVLALRNRLLQLERHRSTVARVRPPIQELMALMIKAFNLYRKNKSCKILRWSAGEPFPSLPKP